MTKTLTQKQIEKIESLHNHNYGFIGSYETTTDINKETGIKTYKFCINISNSEVDVILATENIVDIFVYILTNFDKLIRKSDARFELAMSL